ncbi:MAG TPA: signal peptidase I [Pirellulales bacterium]
MSESGETTDEESSLSPRTVSPRNVPPRDDAIRAVVEFIVCVTSMILLATTWIVEPFIVPSGSMATTLLGPHRRIVCRECGFAFDVGSDEDDRAARVCCPNCEAVRDDVTEPVAKGDRLLVAKQAFRVRDPARFEVAVFRRPGQAGQAYVKRIVGLPGESLLIRDGDLFIDGQRVHKTLAEQRGLAVLVHDAAFESPEIPPAWHPSGGSSCWSARPGGRFQAAAASDATLPGETSLPREPLNLPSSTTPSPLLAVEPTAAAAEAEAPRTTFSPRESRATNEATRRPIHWLDYEHMVRPLAPHARSTPGPIVDRLAYNQIQRVQLLDEFDTTHDLLLRTKLAAAGEGAIYFRANAGADQFFAEVHPDSGAVELFHNGRRVASGALPESLSGETPKLVEWSVIDAQAVLAVEGRLCFAPYRWEPSGRAANSGVSPLAIGAQGPAVDVHELQVWRDVYYTDPYRRAGRPRGAVAWGVDAPYQLGPDEYFMLGDNSRYSEDSRLWPEGPGVPRSAMIGKAVVVHYPSRWMEWGARSFHVPDWERIRYIR